MKSCECQILPNLPDTTKNNKTAQITKNIIHKKRNCKTQAISGLLCRKFIDLVELSRSFAGV